MAKVVLYTAVTMDGFIARSDGNLDWLHATPNPESGDYGYEELLSNTGVIIMGRKTYESIGRPLPGRTNIVVTRSSDWSAEGVIVVNSLEQALVEARKAVAASDSSVAEAMIIGGAEIYRSALPLVDKVYLTRVQLEVEGDAFFPQLPPTDWQLVSSMPGDSEAGIAHQFLVYERAQ